LLGGRPALRGAAARRGRAGLLPAAAGGAGGVRDLGRALLRHALVLQRLVLLLVLDAGTLAARHAKPLSSWTYDCFRGRRAANDPASRTGGRERRARPRRGAPDGAPARRADDLRRGVRR